MRLTKDLGLSRPPDQLTAAPNRYHPFRSEGRQPRHQHTPSGGHRPPTLSGSPERQSRPAEARSPGTLGRFSSRTVAVRLEEHRAPCLLLAGCGLSQAGPPSVAGWLGGGVFSQPHYCLGLSPSPRPGPRARTYKGFSRQPHPEVVAGCEPTAWGGWGGKGSGMVLGSGMGRRRSRHRGPLRAESRVAAGGPEQICPRHREPCLGEPCWGQWDRSSGRCAGPSGPRCSQGRRPGGGPTPPWLEEQEALVWTASVQGRAHPVGHAEAAYLHCPPGAPVVAAPK